MEIVLIYAEDIGGDFYTLCACMLTSVRIECTCYCIRPANCLKKITILDCYLITGI
jgi:hypothetical protein